MTPEIARPTLAVFDFGKTNAKLLVFGADGSILAERRTRAAWPVVDGVHVLDDAALLDWMREVLREAVASFDVNGIMITTHGCTFALLGEDALATPILDYEEIVPAEVEAAFARIRPPFSETATPAMERGFAFGKHIVWQEMRDPTLAARTRHILTLPQFWVWRLCGARVSEISSLGCHTHLWSPYRDDFSSLVDRRGWRGKMPPFREAGAIVGTMTLDVPGRGAVTLDVHNGVHDSNASLSHYRRVVPGGMTMVSTGTWVIVMNPDCPLDALVPERDMLANVSVRHEPVPTARFMGGREFDLIRGDGPADVTEARIASLVARGIFALPSFADGGPYPGQAGAFVDDAGRSVVPAPDERAALAALYVAAMTDLTLDLLRSTDAVVFDGGLAKVGAIPRLVAALRPAQAVLVGRNPEGTACGAAGLAYAALGLDPFRDERAARVAPFDPPGWREYVTRWRHLADQRTRSRTEPAAPAPDAPNKDNHDAPSARPADLPWIGTPVPPEDPAAGGAARPW
ncbi:carbohydrate kinase [Gluconacetobacter diazotrophicus]|uniref:Carbohydrate kinase n=1 Tax=Gluconacetobacter diazotrophicus TaxID=33996 RepID=A0A7W4I6D0_GLUDI|nr:carbohydrate kinase [Gluconacetobacter diazotrophicus]MBB2157113.1 carbohydrate kinase [Gluconacetobacter diazotrophicus]